MGGVGVEEHTWGAHTHEMCTHTWGLLHRVGVSLTHCAQSRRVCSVHTWGVRGKICKPTSLCALAAAHKHKMHIAHKKLKQYFGMNNFKCNVMQYRAEWIEI